MLSGLSPLAVAARGGGSAFSPLALFSGGTDGTWFPTSDLTALFKTNFGETGNVAANDDTVGLALDKHLMGGLSASAFIAAQAEMVLNGDFSNGTTSWSAVGTASLSVASGALRVTSGGGATDSGAQAFTTVANRWYQLTGNRVGSSGGTTRVRADATAGNGGFLNEDPAASFSYIFKATGTTTYVSLVNVGAGTYTDFDNISLKPVVGNHASQATASFRPKYKTATISRKYDGSDDRLVGTAKGGASGNSIAAKIIAPATVAATQVIAGMQADSSTRFYLALNTSGQLCGGVGTDGTATIVGTTDVRGLTGVATLIEDGSNVFLYWNGNLEYTGARNGTPSTTPVIYEGALNNNGTAASFYSGEIYDSIFRQSALTAGERAQLVSYWS